MPISRASSCNALSVSRTLVHLQSRDYYNRVFAMEDVLLGGLTPRGRDVAEEEHLKELELHFQRTPFGSPVVGSTGGSSVRSVDSETVTGQCENELPTAEEQKVEKKSVEEPQRSTATVLLTSPCLRPPPPVQRCGGESPSSYASLFNLASPASTCPSPASTRSTSNPGIVPQLQNIVATANLCCRLDLKKIALQARNAEYNPRRFAAAIMRIREPRTTALFFGSGKIVCTGAKSEANSRIAARKFARIAQKLGFDASFSDFKVQNIVASCDVGFGIRLESLALNHAQFCRYEPELFPGLVYSMVQPRTILLIFVSGKVVLTGAKIRQDLYRAFDNIYPILVNYRKH
ncbi:uncharacterized protein LOC135401357 [Ornithodoros turicata]|uniref:uncharacterized protein LOC135401357 n=1 Tax=Ornithodoros turicata TaxID=34597 RepID=UPI0031390224